MDVLNIVSTLVSTVGFPIVAVGAVAWYCKYTNDNYRKDTKDLTASHEKEIDKLTTALNNNTIALTKLCEKLDKE